MLRPRAALLNVPEYQAPESGRTGLRLDFNESTMGCSPRVLTRIRELTSQDIAQYVGREEAEECVAKFFRVAPEQLILTNGVDEAIHLLCTTYLSPGDEMLTLAPTFSMYEINAIACGASARKVEYLPGYRFPLQKLIENINEKTRLICIANPNNPTGTVASRGDLMKLVEAAPNAAVLIDEAYFEFYGESVMARVGFAPNLFVSRTFSKAYGMAGLRIGAMCGPAEQIALIKRAVSPFNVNCVALACIPEALADPLFIVTAVAEVRESRKLLENSLRELGIDFIPSSANFVLAFLGSRKDEVIKTLAQRNIFVRDRENECGNGAVRISLGSRSETQRVVDCLRSVFSKVAAEVSA